MPKLSASVLAVRREKRSLWIHAVNVAQSLQSKRFMFGLLQAQMHFTTLRDLHYLSRSYMHQTRQMQKVYRATESKAVLELQRGVDDIFVRTMPLHYMCLRQHHAKKNANPQEKGRNFGATGLRLHRLRITNTVAARCRNESKLAMVPAL